MDESERTAKLKQLDFSGIQTHTAFDRTNLVRVDTLKTPGEEVDMFTQPGFEELAQRVVDARRQGGQVIWSQGAHVIKCGLSRYLIGLMEGGIITHLTGNGACAIHDFELSYLGGTSEHVPTAIEDGSFGMWEETGAWMNEAIQIGAKEGWGLGEALARYMQKRPGQFPYRRDCVLYRAYELGIPCTYHIALGTDIIHQHPSCDFAAIGAACQVDFKRFCYSVSQMEGGVFLNFGSMVIGPEVFLKALSIARNLGHATFDITTADFDLRNLGDFRQSIGDDHPDYYYRPRKNIVNRPTSRGGSGWHFTGPHQQTIPSLYQLIRQKGWPLP